MEEQTDEDIMQEFQEGDKEAINMIFYRYKTYILNFCLRILGNRADAEDITGEVFLALFSNRYTYDPNAKFSTWLFTIARNKCISRIRKRKNVISMWFQDSDKGGFQQWEVEDDSDTSLEQLEKNEAAKHVQWAIKQLPLQQREAIVLREYHNFNYDEIAQILNCSLEKVKILIFRSREQLRTELASFIKEAQE